MTQQPVSPNVSSPHDYTEKDVTVRGLRLRVRRRRGDGGPPLLLIHGLGGSLDSWGPLLDNLPGRDVVMIDTPGMGRSELPRFPLGVHAIADRFVGAVTELGVDRVDVLGFSHGGTVAQEFAHRHPDRIRRLVLVDTIAGVPWVPPRLTVQRALLSTRRYRSRAAAERDLPILAGGRTARDQEMLRTILDDRESHPPSKRGYRYLQLGVLGWSSIPWLHTLTCPTLVVHGADDPVVRPVNARFLASQIPNARFELLSGAGHMVLFDESERAGRILMRFLGTP
jgi:pimeloyl-ACP methyl ester carboxylesterase